MQGLTIQDSGRPSRLTKVFAFAALSAALAGLVAGEQEGPGVDATVSPTATPAYRQANTIAANHVLEKPLGVMAATLPPALYEFLTPDVSRFDVPLVVGQESPAPTIPGPEVVDLRGATPLHPGRRLVRPLGALIPGSNNWALAGHRTTHGGAILANDPHLVLGVPNIWYRTRLIWDDGMIQGAGPAGIPGIVIGANTHMAWGVTNSMIDQNDWIVVETDPADPSRYLTPQGWQHFDLADEGTVRLTRWGPVLDKDWLAGEFFTTVQKRGAAIIKARGSSSAASAASAAIDHMRDAWFGTGDSAVSMCVPSDGSYGVPEGMVFSFPCRCKGMGAYEIVNDVAFDAFGEGKIAATREELQAEASLVADLV